MTKKADQSDAGGGGGAKDVQPESAQRAARLREQIARLKGGLPSAPQPAGPQGGKESARNFVQRRMAELSRGQSKGDDANRVTDQPAPADPACDPESTGEGKH